LIALPRYQCSGGGGTLKSLQEAEEETVTLTHSNDSADIPQRLLIVTEANLNTCGLFSPRLVKFLANRFNCCRGQPELTVKETMLPSSSITLRKTKKRKRRSDSDDDDDDDEEQEKVEEEQSGKLFVSIYMKRKGR
jgi:hypothetical protein